MRPLAQQVPYSVHRRRHAVRAKRCLMGPANPPELLFREEVEPVFGPQIAIEAQARTLYRLRRKAPGFSPGDIRRGG